jgi:hypothetical protein
MRRVFSGCFYFNSRFEIVFILATGYHNDANYKKTLKCGLYDFLMARLDDPNCKSSLRYRSRTRRGKVKVKHNAIVHYCLFNTYILINKNNHINIAPSNRLIIIKC